MTIITTEIQKWKRNKIVWCILALTLLLGAFAIERACSISRSSPFMDSFGDLYTLAFKNLSSLFLPIVLGMFATTLFFDEHKNDTMKELLITALIVSDEIYSEFVNSDTCMVYWNFCIPNELVETKGLMLPIMEARDLLKPSGLYYESYLNNFGRQLFYVISGSYTTLYMGFMFLIIACRMRASAHRLWVSRRGPRHRLECRRRRLRH